MHQCSKTNQYSHTVQCCSSVFPLCVKHSGPPPLSPLFYPLFVFLPEMFCFSFILSLGPTVLNTTLHCWLFSFILWSNIIYKQCFSSDEETFLNQATDFSFILFIFIISLIEPLFYLTVKKNLKQIAKNKKHKMVFSNMMWSNSP